jgi:hypothetical protein
MGWPAFADPEKWIGLINAIGVYNTIILMVWLASCLAFLAQGHRWLGVILLHRREMLKIKNKEKARKEALDQKIEATLEKGKSKGKAKGSSS